MLGWILNLGAGSGPESLPSVGGSGRTNMPSPFVINATVAPDGNATSISFKPSLFLGGYLSAVNGNASLWVLDSSGPISEITPSDWDNSHVFFVNKEDGAALQPLSFQLVNGLSVSLGGTGASATILYTNRNVKG
jgi:hypothetical protein